MTAHLRVLVVDDSAYNRRNIADMLERQRRTSRSSARPATARRRCGWRSQLKPDVITLDLEMPQMDGFTFLRILMARQPTPVIVVSSYAQKENVFKALELGALDFVAKPSRHDLARAAQHPGGAARQGAHGDAAAHGERCSTARRVRAGRHHVGRLRAAGDAGDAAPRRARTGRRRRA